MEFRLDSSVAFPTLVVAIDFNSRSGGGKHRVDTTLAACCEEDAL